MFKNQELIADSEHLTQKFRKNGFFKLTYKKIEETSCA